MMKQETKIFISRDVIFDEQQFENENDEESNLVNFDIPRTYSEASNRTDHEKWKHATNEEIESLIEKGT